MVDHSHDDPIELPVDPDLTPPPRRWDVALVVAAGGAIGGALRYAINELLPHPPGGWPWSTFTENVLGCLAIGFLMYFVIEVWGARRYARPFLGVGILGGFTTFSAYTTDALTLLRDDSAPLALLYLFSTLALGLLATWTGLTVARRLTHGRSR